MIANDLLPKGANPTTNKSTLNIKKVSKKLPYIDYIFSTLIHLFHFLFSILDLFTHT